MKSISKDGVRLDNSGYLSSQVKQQAINALAAGMSPATNEASSRPSGKRRSSAAIPNLSSTLATRVSMIRPDQRRNGTWAGTSNCS